MIEAKTTQRVHQAHERRFGQALADVRAARKDPHGTPAYSRFVNRPVGRVLAAACFVAGLTPNQVSLVSASFSFAAIGLLATQTASWPLAVAVAVLLALGYAFDSADGQVARLTGRSSVLGEWLDHMIDCAKILALHLATAAFFLREANGDATALVLPMLYLFVSAVLFFGMILTDQLRRSVGDPPGQAKSSLSVVRSVVILPSDYGMLCLIYLLLGIPDLFIWAYLAMFAGTALLLAAALIRWVRLLGRIDASRAA